MEFTPRCPTCRAIVEWQGNQFRPFCSERCQLSDFGAWVTEEYRIPGSESAVAPEAPDDDDSAENGSA